MPRQGNCRSGVVPAVVAAAHSDCAHLVMGEVHRGLLHACRLSGTLRLIGKALANERGHLARLAAEQRGRLAY